MAQTLAPVAKHGQNGGEPAMTFSQKLSFYASSRCGNYVPQVLPLLFSSCPFAQSEHHVVHSATLGESMFGANGRVLGCHIVGEAAAEITQAVAIAVKLKATKADFDSTIALHPTAAEELVTMRTDGKVCARDGGGVGSRRSRGFRAATSPGKLRAQSCHRA
jgi:hypothetical protein